MIDPATTYNITIQCSLDGFCFVVHDVDKNTIVDITNYQTSGNSDSGAIMDALDKALFNKDLYDRHFKSVTFIVDNRDNSLVPDEFFDEDSARALLQFSHPLSPDSQVLHDSIECMQATNVYALPQPLIERVMKTWDNAHIVHEATVFIESILKEEHPEGPTAFVNVKSRDFDLAIVRDQKLVFYNNFKFNTQDDFVYFLIYALEQYQIDPQLVPIYFTGMINGNSEIIRLCERYIKDLRFFNVDSSIALDVHITDTPYQYYYIPYKALSCES